MGNKWSEIVKKKKEWNGMVVKWPLMVRKRPEMVRNGQDEVGK